eukprot:3673925-Prorocentrum_lima.AAC.1
MLPCASAAQLEWHLQWVQQQFIASKLAHAQATTLSWQEWARKACQGGGKWAHAYTKAELHDTTVLCERGA